MYATLSAASSFDFIPIVLEDIRCIQQSAKIFRRIDLVLLQRPMVSLRRYQISNFTVVLRYYLAERILCHSLSLAGGYVNIYFSAKLRIKYKIKHIRDQLRGSEAHTSTGPKSATRWMESSGPATKASASEVAAQDFFCEIVLENDNLARCPITPEASKETPLVSAALRRQSSTSFFPNCWKPPVTSKTIGIYLDNPFCNVRRRRLSATSKF